MTQYPPKTFFLQGIFQAIEVVLHNTQIQTRGPNAGGGVFSRYYIPDTATQAYFGYIVMLRARMFRSLIIRTGIKERNIRARNITI